MPWFHLDISRNMDGSTNSTKNIIQRPSRQLLQGKVPMAAEKGINIPFSLFIAVTATVTQ
jgi:hypothetical protein